MTTITKADFEQILKRSPEDILQLMLQVAQAHRSDPANAYIIDFDDIPKEPPTIKLEDFGWLAVDYSNRTVRTVPLHDREEVRERMLNWLPFMDELSFEGYVIAGSFVILACTSSADESPSDIDFYPIYDPAEVSDKHNITAHDLVMRSYQRFLSDMDECFENLVPRAPESKLNITVTRTEQCTTIRHSMDSADLGARNNPNAGALNWSFMAREQYQIIQRAHTSAPGVVVGFDLLCCKAYARGEDIIFTLDAALCLYFGINPIDWRRESPSHIHRILKYERYGFVPIFPGLKPFTDTTYMFSNGTITARVCGKKELPKKTQYNLESFSHWEIERRREVERQTRIQSRSALQKDNETFAADDEHGSEVNFEGDESDDEPLDMSDYGSNDLMTMYYTALSQIVKGKMGAACAIASRPVDIVSNFTTIPVHTLLCKLAGGPRTDFYFEQHANQLLNITDSLKRLCISEGGSRGNTRMKPLTREQLATAVKLNEEIREIIETRTAEIGKLLNPVVERLQKVTFMTVNPGIQYTATFNPTIRKHPRDYFGERYQDCEISILMPLKRYLLWMRKQPFTTGGIVNNYFAKLPGDVFKMLIRWLDRMYIRDFMADRFGDAQRHGLSKQEDDLELENLVIRASCTAGVK